jgi:putative addiction module killer protein
LEATPKDLVYTDEFAYWEDSLDPRLRGIVRVRLRRVSKGLFGNSHSVGEGVSELVIPDGSGHRIYFGRAGNKVILLTGGAKNTQPKDIARAKTLWRRENNG